MYGCMYIAYVCICLRDNVSCICDGWCWSVSDFISPRIIAPGFQSVIFNKKRNVQKLKPDQMRTLRAARSGVFVTRYVYGTFVLSGYHGLDDIRSGLVYPDLSVRI